jgi:hypothetical protein
MVRAFGIYDVGRADGKPIEPPPFYANEERAAQAAYPKGPLPLPK